MSAVAVIGIVIEIYGFHKASLPVLLLGLIIATLSVAAKHCGY